MRACLCIHRPRRSEWYQTGQHIQLGQGDVGEAVQPGAPRAAPECVPPAATARAAGGHAEFAAGAEQFAGGVVEFRQRARPRGW